VIRPLTFGQKLRRDAEIAADLDRVRAKLIESLAGACEGEKGYKALLRAHARGERLRRELFQCWYAEPTADAPLLTEKLNVDIQAPSR
jgi:hypothetical protein